MIKSNLQMAKGPERQDFMPTPERIAQRLGIRNVEEVSAQLTSAKGREELFSGLAKTFKENDPSFNPNQLRTQLELVGNTLGSKEKFLKSAQSPEKKSWWKWTLEKAKNVLTYPYYHPYKTAGYAALLAAAVAGGFYVTGNWELFLAKTGLNKILAAVEAARELVPVTPATPLEPGGGVLDVPGPMPGPQIGPYNPETTIT